MFAALNAFQVGGVPTLVSDVFSTTLYTGSGSSQTITNGINLSTKGGLVWTKFQSGSIATASHALTDTARGVNNYLSSNSTNAATTSWTDTLTAFNTNGYTLGADATTSLFNYGTGTNNYVSWTFRKAPKFFDIVTYTGDGTSDKAISHNLGSDVGSIIVKGTSSSSYWRMQHRKANKSGTGDYCMLTLNTTDNANDRSTTATYFGSADPTSTVFYVSNTLNASGETYVAYLFAHDAGGFGVSGNDNVISCGSYTGSNGSGQSISLGYKPQWLLVKNTSRASTNWVLMDKFRNFNGTGYGWLYPNSASAEDSGSGAVYLYPTSTGFTTVDANANTDYLSDSYIYIAVKDNS